MKKHLKQDAFKVSITKKEENIQYQKGRGAQINTHNKFLKHQYKKDDIESIDDWEVTAVKTQYIEQKAKTIVNKVDSPDVGMAYSMNAYAGCEHGCIYCYARNVHEYWGYSAGLDFERKIIVKTNAAEMLQKQLTHPKWEVKPIMISGNTDCYQPAEKRYKLTRQLLEVCNSFNQPIGMLTKNALITRDIDVLQELARKNLASILISVTSFNEELRRTMEPRTSTASQRLHAMEQLAKAGVPVGVMLGPMIPGLNDHELQRIMKASADAGATFTSYTFIRLNGAIKELFHDWLYKNMPDRADKVWHFIEESHGGKVNDSRWGLRMRGEGPIANIIAQQYKKYGKIYGMNKHPLHLNTQIFKRPGGIQGTLF